MASLAGSRLRHDHIKKEYQRAGLEQDHPPAPAKSNQIAVPDGRRCRMCDIADDVPDRVDVSLMMKWGYPPKNGRNQGKVVGRALFLRRLLAKSFS
jgi:hypothetical protein